MSCDDLTHHLACDVPARLGQRVAQAHQRRGEVDVGCDGFEHLGLQQQPVQVQAVDRVLLHDPHDPAGKVRAQLPQPARDAGRRGAQPTLPGAVDGVERTIDPAVLAPELLACPLRLAAPEHEPPPPKPLLAHVWLPSRRATVSSAGRARSTSIKTP